MQAQTPFVLRPYLNSLNRAGRGGEGEVDVFPQADGKGGPLNRPLARLKSLEHEGNGDGQGCSKAPVEAGSTVLVSDDVSRCMRCKKEKVEDIRGQAHRAKKALGAAFFPYQI